MFMVLITFFDTWYVMLVMVTKEKFQTASILFTN